MTPAPAAVTIWAATDGSPAGAGTEGDPYDLTTGLAAGRPNYTLNIKAGTYSGTFTTGFAYGKTDYPFTIQPAIGADVRIDVNGGALTLGDNCILDGGYRVEIYDSSWSDRNSDNGSEGINANGSGCQVRNCIIHDVGQGFKSPGAGGENLLIYGCLVFFCGWDANLGHGLYAQNDGPTTKTFKDCLVFDNFGYGFHLFGSGGSIKYFTIEGCTAFNTGSIRSSVQRNILFDSSDTIQTPIVRDTVTYHGVADSINIIGDSSNDTLAVEVYDNYIVSYAGSGGALQIRGSTIDITRLNGNTFIGTTAGWDTETYSDNTYTTTLPSSGQTTFLRQNDYNSNFANLIIFNWADANTLDVDVSSVYGSSGAIMARNVQDYWNDTQILDITAGVITIDMQAINRTASNPIGWTAPTKTFPRFGCFVLSTELAQTPLVADTVTVAESVTVSIA